MQKLGLVLAVSVIVSAHFDMTGAKAANCANELTADSSWEDVVSCLRELSSELQEVKADRPAADHVHDAVPTHTHDTIPPHSHSGEYAAVDHSHAAELPEGSVVLFSKNYTEDETEPCPVGWSLLQEATGRVAIGAGQPSQKLDAEFVREFGKYEIYDPTTDQMIEVNLRPHRRENDEWLYYRLKEVGGAEMVTLNLQQMPRHAHLYTFTDHHNTPGNPDTTPGEFGRANTPTKTTIAGNSRPHNNIPPYIALYFCKKD